MKTAKEKLVFLETLDWTPLCNKLCRESRKRIKRVASKVARQARKNEIRL